MIVILGSLPIDPAKHEEAKTHIRTMMDATHQEAGCISYEFLFSPWNDAVVHFAEEWESQEALDAHSKSEHMATFVKNLQGVATGKATIKRYIVSEVTDM